jgi:hypothetical protein
VTRFESLEALYYALNTKPDIDQANLYLNETADFSDPVFAAACRTLGRISTFFPKLSELIAACRLENKMLAEADPRMWFKCTACGDSGWVTEHCPGGTSRCCGRSEMPGWQDGKYWGTCRVPHPFARRCGHAVV